MHYKCIINKLINKIINNKLIMHNKLIINNKYMNQ